MKNIRIRRGIALLIDMGIISIIALICDKLLPDVILINVRFFGIRPTPGIALFPVFYASYFLFFDITANGRSVGKLISGILVVLENGEALSMRERLLRSWYKMIGVLMCSPAIAAILFIAKHYTIQDHHARTTTILNR